MQLYSKVLFSRICLSYSGGKSKRFKCWRRSYSINTLSNCRILVFRRFSFLITVETFHAGKILFILKNGAITAVLVLLCEMDHGLNLQRRHGSKLWWGKSPSNQDALWSKTQRGRNGGDVSIQNSEAWITAIIQQGQVGHIYRQGTLKHKHYEMI